MEALIPKWHRELELFCGIKPMLILDGNVLDQYRYPVPGSVGEDQLVSLPRYLQGYFQDQGYDQVVFYSNLLGFMNPYNGGMLTRFAHMTGTTVDQGAIPAEFKGNKADTAPNVIRRALCQQERAVAVVLEMASHYITTPDRMDQQDVNSFNLLLQAVLSAAQVRTPQGRRQNLLVLLVNKVNDLPSWLYLNNPQLKNLTLETPTERSRERLLCVPPSPAFLTAPSTDADALLRGASRGTGTAEEPLSGAHRGHDLYRAGRHAPPEQAGGREHPRPVRGGRSL